MIYRAIVADNRDPSSKGRLKVMIPALSGQAISDWIWPIVSSGYLVVPAPGNQVWVTFENGDTDVPVWIGATKADPDLDLPDRIAVLEQTVANLATALAALTHT